MINLDLKKKEREKGSFMLAIKFGPFILNISCYKLLDAISSRLLWNKSNTILFKINRTRIKMLIKSLSVLSERKRK